MANSHTPSSSFHRECCPNSGHCPELGQHSRWSGEDLVVSPDPGAYALVLTHNVCSAQLASSGGNSLPCPSFSCFNAPPSPSDGNQGCPAHSPPGLVQPSARVPATAIPERLSWISSLMLMVPSPACWTCPISPSVKSVPYRFQAKHAIQFADR